MKPSLLVRCETQTAELWQDGKLVKSFPISTASNGLGCDNDSFCTPTGRLRVAQKIGEGAPFGAVFRSRVWNGEVWSSHRENPLCLSEEDLVLTRILWLEGLEEKNANTLDRYIYLHGTNQESLLGRPASHGCVRFSNLHIVEIFDLLPIGAEVEIV